MTLGKITAINKNKITIELDEEVNLNYLKLLADGGDNYAKVKFLDNRGITAKQNNLSHSLIGDIAKYSYDEPLWIESVLKYYYKSLTGEDFSHSKATRDEANKFIDFLIKFILKNNIELPKKYEYLTEKTSWFYYCLKYRRCCICGKHADICHVDVVGNGRNRNKINHDDLRFYAGCRTHHQEEHNLGINNFLKKYKITPIKLSLEDRNKLNVGG